MNSVLVRLRGQEGVRGIEITLRDETTIRDLILRLSLELSGDLQQMVAQVREGIDSGYIVAVNGVNIQSLREFDTVIGDGDVVSILPVVVGG